MKIIVFGATGTVGRHLVKQALDQGHDVSAFVRDPGKVTLSHPKLQLIVGDVFDRAAVAAAVADHEAVLCTLGSSKLTGRVRSAGTQNIIDAMAQAGVRRIVCQTTLGGGLSWGNLNFYWKWVMFRGLLRFVFDDHAVQELMVQESGLDWTIVRPSAFTDGERSDDYQHGFSSHAEGLSLNIARADVAHFMLEQLTHDGYLHRTPGLVSGP